MRTSGAETAPAQRPVHKSQHGRNQTLVNANESNQNVAAQGHFIFFKSPARRNAVKKSCSTVRNCFPAMEGLATKTKSTGTVNSCWCKRKFSRSNRRTRVRSTALPTLRLVTIPTRKPCPGAADTQFATKQPQTNRWPCVFAREKSRPVFMRCARVSLKRGRGGLGMVFSRTTNLLMLTTLEKNQLAPNRQAEVSLLLSLHHAFATDTAAIA